LLIFVKLTIKNLSLIASVVTLQDIYFVTVTIKHNVLLNLVLQVVRNEKVTTLFTPVILCYFKVLWETTSFCSKLKFLLSHLLIKPQHMTGCAILNLE